MQPSGLGGTSRATSLVVNVVVTRVRQRCCVFTLHTSKYMLYNVLAGPASTDHGQLQACSNTSPLIWVHARAKSLRRTFAGWALTEGQHRPKAGKKKKTREAGLFFLVPTSFQ